MLNTEKFNDKIEDIDNMYKDLHTISKEHNIGDVTEDRYKVLAHEHTQIELKAIVENAKRGL